MPVSPDTLRNKLSLKFELVCFVDLAEISHQHSAIFSLLEHYHKDAYTPYQRLVFYTSHQLDQKFLNHLQRAVSSVDISNFFVVICTPYDVSSGLQKANHMYGHDDSVINWISIDLADTDQISSDNFYPYDTMCPLPFTSLFVTVDGTAAPCCKIADPSGNIYKNTLSDIFHSSNTQNIRRQMQQGSKPDACKVCWHIDDIGGTSLRRHSIDKLGKQLDRGWIDNLSIKDISITPSSLCNFKCRICNPGTSSQVAVEELQYANTLSDTSKLKQFLKFARSNVDPYIQQLLLEIQNDLKYLRVLGGEPFMLPGLEELMCKLISSGHSSHIFLEFNTNGSIWPSSIVELFEHFRKVEILVSIDNIGSKFETERSGVWEEIEQNLCKFAAIASDTVSIKMIVTISIQNLLYLENIIEFANTIGVSIVWSYLESPENLCIDHVTQEVKDLVYQQYHNHPNSELAKISNRLQCTPATTGHEFLQYIDTIDQRRGQEFFKTHPEIYTAMGGQIDR